MRCGSKKNESGNYSKNASPVSETVRLRRFFETMIFGFLGIRIGCYGRNYFYKDRMFLGTTIILRGGLLGCCCLLLRCLSDTPIAWGWWL